MGGIRGGVVGGEGRQESPQEPGRMLQAGFGSFSNNSAPAVSTSVTYVHSRKLFTNFTSSIF